jgi:hypothetical protein
MRRLFVVLLLPLVASSDSQKPAPDAPPPSIDAAVCATPADCPCFSNYDCPSTHKCKSQGATVSCIAGPRGTGAPGSVCTTEDDCATALCVEAATGFRCSDLCRTAATCPAELPRCVSLGEDGICAREPPSMFGE